MPSTQVFSIIRQFPYCKMMLCDRRARHCSSGCRRCRCSSSSLYPADLAGEPFLWDVRQPTTLLSSLAVYQARYMKYLYQTSGLVLPTDGERCNTRRAKAAKRLLDGRKTHTHPDVSAFWDEHDFLLYPNSLTLLVILHSVINDFYTSFFSRTLSCYQIRP